MLYPSPWGDPKLESFGLYACTANRYLMHRNTNQSGTLDIDDVGNGHAVITDLKTRKWFFDSHDAVEERYARGMNTVMLGATCGDVAGSVYEHHNIKYCLEPDQLISHYAHFTDDTVTIAVADGIKRALKAVPESWLGDKESEDTVFASIRDSLQEYGRRYPYAGYGGHFKRWIYSDNPNPMAATGMALRCVPRILARLGGRLPRRSVWESFRLP